MVDLRARRAFAAGHLAGTLSFDLDGSFATYLGWLIPWGTPLTLLGHTPEQVAEAQRELVRIGIDRPAAAATGDPARLGRRPGPAQLPRRRLRRPGGGPPSPPGRRSWTCAATPNGTPRTSPAPCTSPSTSCPPASPTCPEGEVWVHCEAGYRASVAASFLDAAGRTVVAVDDEFARAARAGLPVDGHLAHAAAS